MDKTLPDSVQYEEDKPKKKILPQAITSYDLLKTLALILMLIDHTGYYFFPYVAEAHNTEVIWFRVLGRLSVPIWFFLIGYAHTTEIPPRLLIWAALAQFSKMAAGEFVLPLNILFTIAAARYVRDACAQKAVEKPEHMRGMVLLLILGTLPTAMFLEYGSLILMFVVYGYLRRNPGAVKVQPLYVRLFTFAAFFFYLFWEGVTMGVLTVDQTLAMIVGLLVVFFILRRFQPREYPKLTKVLGPFSAVLKLTGRRTLEIYVLHLLVFRAAALILYPETYTFWDWSIMDPGLMSMIVRQG